MGHYACDMRPEWFEPEPARKTPIAKSRVLWVVETLEDGGWHPTEWVGLTRERARDEARAWRAESCGGPVRVTKYVA
jgi:hypothetical protein